MQHEILRLEFMWVFPNTLNAHARITVVMLLAAELKTTMGYKGSEYIQWRHGEVGNLLDVWGISSNINTNQRVHVYSDDLTFTQKIEMGLFQL